MSNSIPIQRQSLGADAPKRMSNVGAQHKLAVCIREGELFEPFGSTPSTHLLQPNRVDMQSWSQSVANEFFVMRLAARLGLAVPPVQIRYVPDPVYIIERFDRQSQGQAPVGCTSSTPARRSVWIARSNTGRRRLPISIAASISACIQRAAVRATSARLLGTFTAQIRPAADELVQEFEAMDIPRRLVRAGQLRVINSIRYVVIRDMVARLR